MHGNYKHQIQNNDMCGERMKGIELGGRTLGISNTSLILYFFLKN